MPNNYVLLERIELNASAASVTFANIPQTGYTDLKVVLSTRTTDTTANDSTAIALQFNGDTASNYSRRSLVGDGASATSTNATTTSMRIGFTTTNGCTANTFGNGEFYVPNYTGSTQKSVSADAVAENNSATYIYSALNAGLWTGTAAITSITVLTPSFSFVANSTFSLYALAALGTTPAIAPKASGGNIIDYDGTYWIHTFLSSGTFTPQVGLTCDYLVVAGGGGGGTFLGSTMSGGGGGAGGFRSTVTATGGGGTLESALSLLTATNYAVTVGAGGSGTLTGNVQPTNGSNSIFSTITSTGGGYGAAAADNGSFGLSATTGGSGGGASTNASYIKADGTANQGFGGGTGNTTDGTVANRGAGGGGGAGAVGNNGSNTAGGAGGAGVASSISGSSVTRGGGGGGARYNGSAGAGGSGGGGAGGSNSVGTSGTANTGGGGGAGSNANAGNGGSGVVIIRYLAS